MNEHDEHVEYDDEFYYSNISPILLDETNDRHINNCIKDAKIIYNGYERFICFDDISFLIKDDNSNKILLDYYDYIYYDEEYNEEIRRLIKKEENYDEIYCNKNIDYYFTFYNS